MAALHNDVQLQELLSHIPNLGTSVSSNNLSVAERLLGGLYQTTGNSMKDRLQTVANAIAYPQTATGLLNPTKEYQSNQVYINHLIHAAYLNRPVSDGNTNPNGNWPIDVSTYKFTPTGVNYDQTQLNENDLFNVRKLVGALNDAIPASISTAICQTLGVDQKINGQSYFNEKDIATSGASSEAKLAAVINALHSVDDLTSLATDVVGLWGKYAEHRIVEWMKQLYDTNPFFAELFKDLIAQQHMLMNLLRSVNNISSAAAQVQSIVSKQQQTKTERLATIGDNNNMVNYAYQTNICWFTSSPYRDQIVSTLQPEELRAIIQINISQCHPNIILDNIADKNILSAIAHGMIYDQQSRTNIIIEKSIIAGALLRANQHQLLGIDQFMSAVANAVSKQLTAKEMMAVDLKRGMNIMTYLYGRLTDNPDAINIASVVMPQLNQNLNGIIVGYKSDPTNVSRLYELNSLYGYLNRINVTASLHRRTPVLDDLLAVLMEMVRR